MLLHHVARLASLMENAMTVASILQEKGHDIIGIDEDATLMEAVAILAEKRVGALLVRDSKGDIAGMLSERDIVRGLSAEGAPLLEKTVASLMTRAVVTITPQDSVNHVMAVMTHRRFRHLPVLDGGRLVGMISIGDVVKRRIAIAEMEAEELKHYIQSG